MIDWKPVGDTTLAELAGPVTAEALREGLEGRPPRLVVDLSRCPEVEPAPLLEVAGELQGRGGFLALAGVPSSPAGLEGLPRYSSREEAIEVLEMGL